MSNNKFKVLVVEDEHHSLVNTNSFKQITINERKHAIAKAIANTIIFLG